MLGWERNVWLRVNNTNSKKKCRTPFTKRAKCLPLANESLQQRRQRQQGKTQNQRNYLYISSRSKFNSFIPSTKKTEKINWSAFRTPAGLMYSNAVIGHGIGFAGKMQNQPQTDRFNLSCCCQANSKYIVTCDFRSLRAGSRVYHSCTIYINTSYALKYITYSIRWRQTRFAFFVRCHEM